MNFFFKTIILVMAAVTYQDSYSQSGQEPYIYQDKLMPGGRGLSGGAFASALSLDGDQLLVGAARTADTGVAYIYEYDGIDWQKKHTLIPHDGAPEDKFGASVSLLGNLALVSSPASDSTWHVNSGAVLLYRFDGVYWRQVKRFVADNEYRFANFGCSVQLTELFIFIMDCGSNTTYIYKNDGNDWVQLQKFVPNVNLGTHMSGLTFAVSGSKMLVSMRGHIGPGTVLAYQFNGDSWQFIQRIQAINSSSNDDFGRLMSISGNWAMIRNYNNGDPRIGFYAFDGTTWNLTSEVTPSAADGSYGYRLSIHENRALISSGQTVKHYEYDGTEWSFRGAFPSEDHEVNYSLGGPIIQSDERMLLGGGFDDIYGDPTGAIYVFEEQQANWQNTARIIDDIGAERAFFGRAISMSENLMLIGAPSEKINGKQTGAAYIYEQNGQRWSRKQRIVAVDRNDGDYFGGSVVLSGDLAVIGAFGDEQPGYQNYGSVYIYRFNGQSWNQQFKLLAPERSSEDKYGFAVAMSDNLLFVGSPGDDDQGENSGSVYVYIFNGSTWGLSHKLTPPNKFDGQGFGIDIKLSDDRLFIKANGDGIQAGYRGAIYSYRLSNMNWDVEHQFISQNNRTSFFGYSFGVHQNQLLISERFDDSERDSVVNVYEYDGQEWLQTQELSQIHTGFGASSFGSSISLDNESLLIGAVSAVHNGVQTGAAYLYKHNGFGWYESMKVGPRDGTLFDWFGHKVIVADEKMFISAEGEDGRGTNSGAVYVYENDRISHHGFEVMEID